jgi:hypothetical protein
MEMLIQTILTGIIGWAVKTMLDQLKTYRAESKAWRADLGKKIDSINDATQATMRTTILHYCEKYITRGWVTSEELSSLLDMHEKYTALNDHNGFINTYVERVRNLETHDI